MQKQINALQPEWVNIDKRLRNKLELTKRELAHLESCPANLSRNFRLRVLFGISYSLQDKATAAIPEILIAYLHMRMKQEGYLKNCLNLRVEFMQANASSLDLIILGDFQGSVADISKRTERAIEKWYVECCTKHNWEIPFPQLTLHHPTDEQ